MKKKTNEGSEMRKTLIDAIVQFSEDEINEFTPKEFIELAKESNEELLDRIICLLKYYEDEYNNR